MIAMRSRPDDSDTGGGPAVPDGEGPWGDTARHWPLPMPLSPFLPPPNPAPPLSVSPSLPLPLAFALPHALPSPSFPLTSLPTPFSPSLSLSFPPLPLPLSSLSYLELCKLSATIWISDLQSELPNPRRLQAAAGAGSIPATCLAHVSRSKQNSGPASERSSAEPGRQPRAESAIGKGRCRVAAQEREPRPETPSEGGEAFSLPFSPSLSSLHLPFSLPLASPSCSEAGEAAAGPRPRQRSFFVVWAWPPARPGPEHGPAELARQPELVPRSPDSDAGETRMQRARARVPPRRPRLASVPRGARCKGSRHGAAGPVRDAEAPSSSFWRAACLGPSARRALVPAALLRPPDTGPPAWRRQVPTAR